VKALSDQLLLEAAEIAATLIGLLLVGVFFYLQSGFGRISVLEPGAEPFLRSTTKLIVCLYSLVLGLAIGLVALDDMWVSVLFVALSLAVLVAMVEWTVRGRRVSHRFRRAVRVNLALAWPMLIVVLGVPWVLGGWPLERESLAWAVFLGGAVAFWNTADLVLLAFDIAAIEREVGHEEVIDGRPRNSGDPMRTA
jgi:hypothetical protein